MLKNTEVAVIGAGLTGLTLAHNLRKKNRDFVVLERSSNVGGVINTVKKDGFLFETGPNTGVLGNDYVPDLFDELSGYCKLEVAGKNVNKRYIFRKGRLEPLPSGLTGGITTPLFTFGDKLRLLGEPFRKPGTNPNETLDQFVIRRLGKSFLNYAVDPFILGIYAGDPSYLVPKFALPKLYNLEQKYGSFIGGTIKLAREKKRSGIKSRATREIFSVRGGLSNLIQALHKSAGENNVITGVHGIEVTPDNDGFMVSGLQNNEPVSIKAKKVVTTVGAHELPAILPFLETADMDSISKLLYARVVQVSLGFNRWDGNTIDSFGGLIPHRENRDILGILFPSAFLEGRAPEGGALLSIFLGGVRKSHLFELPDESIREIVKREVSQMMGLKEYNPVLVNISRYHHAIPQYGADCEKRFSAIEKAQAEYKGLFIAGNLRNGIGMADRIKQGFELAEELFS